MRNQRSDPYEEAGEIIRSHRQAKGLTLGQLARSLSQCQLSGSTLCRIEKGQRRRIPIDTLAAIAGALDFDLDELVEPFRRPTRRHRPELVA